ncbi:unnamed protein product [Rotaria magnacalcarata]|uniref:Integrase catalytic domain-containing protein n=1 Tax=Rotaria magnacalcarata TaxID=392030 RepID=A0A816WQW5_9BILA|nr:unnamed protein product [Rotaria magnacalcarata]
MGRKIYLWTDHRSLCYMHSMKLINSRLYRTAQEMACYDYTICYIPGRENNYADLLSRIGYEDMIKDATQLREEKLPEGLTVKLIPGGGDSMVHSLSLQELEWKKEEKKVSKFTEHTDADTDKLRLELWNYISDNPGHYGISFTPEKRKQFQVYKAKDYPLTDEFLQCFANKKRYPVEDAMFYEQVKEVKPIKNDNVLLYDELNRLYSNKIEECKFSLPIECYSLNNSYERNNSELKRISDSTENKFWCNHYGKNYSVGTITFGQTQGIKVCALYDSCASLSMMSSSLAQHLDDQGLLIRDTTENLNITGMGGERIQLSIQYAYASPSITSTWSIQNTRWAVMDDDRIPACVIIGFNFLAQNNIILDYNQMKLCSLIGEDTKLGRMHDLKTLSNEHFWEDLKNLLDWQENIDQDLYCNKNIYNYDKNTIPLDNLNPSNFAKFQNNVDLGNCKINSNNVIETISDKISELSKIKELDFYSNLPTFFVNICNSMTNEFKNLLNEINANKCDSKEEGIGKFSKEDNSQTIRLLPIRFNWELLSKVRYIDGLKSNNLSIYDHPEHIVRYSDRIEVVPDLELIKEGVCMFQILDEKEISDVEPIIPEEDEEKSYDFGKHPELIVMWNKFNNPKKRQHLSNDKLVKDVFDVPEMTITDGRNFINEQFNIEKRSLNIDSDELENIKKMQDQKAFSVPIKNRLASTLIKAFEEKIKPHLLGGHISTLRLDNAREHHSKDFVDYFKNQGTKIIYGIPNKSSSGGIVERFNGNLKERLKMKPNTISNQDWIKYHGTVVEDYNNTYHDATGQTPNRRFIDKFPETYPTFKMNTEQRKKLIESLPIHSYFRVGDKVLFQIPRVGRLNVDALKPYYEGPYTIRKVTVPNKCFIIQHDIHKDIQKRADHDQLRKFKTPPKYLQNLAIFQELMMTYHPKHLNPNNDQIEKTSLKIANDTVNMLPTNTVTITTDKKTERSEERPMWKIMELQKPNTDSDRESTESDSSLNDEVLTKTSTRSQSSKIKRKISLEKKEIIKEIRRKQV